MIDRSTPAFDPNDNDGIGNVVDDNAIEDADHAR